MKNWSATTLFDTVSEEDNENYEILALKEKCLVAFFDILGFKKIVKDLKRAVFIFRIIESLTNDYYNIADTVGSAYLKKHKNLDAPDDEDSSHKNNDYGHKRLVFGDEVPKYQIFSDSVLITHPLRCANINNFLSYISKLQFELLSCGVILRGGISMGEIINYSGYVLGQGMINAYALENEHAISPRVLVDIKVLDYFHKQRLGDDWGKIDPAIGYGNYDLPFMINIKRDSDGLFYVDYLCNNFLPNFRDRKLFKEKDFYLNLPYLDESEWGVVSKLFCQEYLPYIMNTIKGGLSIIDEHVRKKYVWLQKYYNSAINFCSRVMTKNEKRLNPTLLEKYLLKVDDQ